MVKAKEIIVLCLVILLLAAALPLVVSADTTQYWYPSKDSAAGDSEADYIMYKGSLGGSGDVVDLDQGVGIVWTADEAAERDVGFPAGDWSYSVSTDDESDDDVTIGVFVGYWDGAFHFEGSEFVDNTDHSQVYTGSIAVDEFEVAKDYWLAYGIRNMEYRTCTFKLQVNDNDTYIASPSSDPGYPIPELPTIVLLATGLVFLAGYLGLKRRKKVYLKT